MITTDDGTGATQTDYNFERSDMFLDIMQARNPASDLSVEYVIISTIENL
jgi:hypothetical protein